MAKNSNNILAIGIGLNTGPLTADIQQAAAITKTGMETIGSSMVAGGAKSGAAMVNAADKVQSLRTQLRQATQDTQQMAEKFGVMSAQAIASAARAGELKDKIGDINTVITAFSADSKFTVVAGALQQAAGAASIVTGAMGLLGTESKATEEMLLKVQSALALTQGLASIKEMGAAFTALNAVIVGQVIPSIMAMGTATILATGGLIVAVVAATAAIISYNNAIDDETAAHLKAAEAAKIQAESEAKITQIVQTTAQLRTAAMKDGFIKDKQLLQDKVNADLNAQYDAYKKGEIALLTYQTRVALIKQAGFNELDNLEEKYRTKKAKPTPQINIDRKQSSSTSDLPRLGVPDAQLGGMDAVTGFSNSLQAKFQEAQAKAALEIQKLNQSLANALTSSLGQTFTGLGEMIGNAIVGNISDPFAALGDILLGSLASLAQQLGAQMIAFGVAQLAFESSVASLNPIGAIAAGTAMVAIGAVIKSLNQGGTKGAAKGGSGGGGSIAQTAYSSNSSGVYFGGGQGANDTLKVTGKVSGRDIVISNNQTLRAQGRSTNIG